MVPELSSKRLALIVGGAHTHDPYSGGGACHLKCRRSSAHSYFLRAAGSTIGLKLKPGTARDGSPSWETNTLGGLKNALVGGSTILSFAAEPVGEATVTDYQRLQGVCAPTGKEVVCSVTEPLRLTVQAKGSTAQVEAVAGEKATVATRGTRIICRNSVANL